MKIIKWILLLLLVIVVLVAAGVGVLVTTFDPNDYKPRITEQVKAKTGRALTIPGQIQWSFYPKLGLTLGQAVLANAEGFGDEPFASIDAAKVYVEVLPLLKKQVKVSTIRLDGVALNLQKNAIGKDNWSDLSQPAPEKESAGKQTTDKPSPASDLDLRINGLVISNASLSYQDDQSGSSLSIDPFTLKAGALVMGETMPVAMDFTLLMDDIVVVASTNGEVLLDLEKNILVVDSKLEASVIQKQASGGETKSDISGQLSARPIQGRYNLGGLKIKSVLENTSAPDGKMEIDVRADVSADSNAQLVDVKNLTINFSDLELQGNLKATQFIDKLGFAGKLSSNTFSPATIMKAAGIEPPQTKSTETFKTASLSFDLSGNKNAIALSPLQMKLDDSTLSGDFSIEDLTAMSVRYDLTIDRLNADNYLPSVSNSPGNDTTEGKARGKSEGKASSDNIVLPLDTIRSLDISGTAKINEMILNELTFNDASLTVLAKDGRVKISPLSADLYQGSATISAQLDATDTAPAYSADINLNGVRSEKILTILFDDPYVSGKANFNAAIQTNGQSVGELKRQLNGQWGSLFTDGTIHGSRLAARITAAQNALRKLQGKAAIEDKTPDETEFSLFSASGDINNGIIMNDNLKLEAPQFLIKGRGRVELPESKLDYTVAISRPDKQDTQRLSLPLRIRGPFADLKYGLKLDALAKQRLNIEKDKLKQQAKEKLDIEKERAKAELDAISKEQESELKEKVKKEEERLKEKLDKGIGDFLKNLGG